MMAPRRNNKKEIEAYARESMDEVCALAVDWVKTNLPPEPTDGFDLDYLEKLWLAAEINDCARTLQTMRKDGFLNSAILQAFVLGQLLQGDSVKPLAQMAEAIIAGGKKGAAAKWGAKTAREDVKTRMCAHV
jgi:hypothetical protein